LRHNTHPSDRATPLARASAPTWTPDPRTPLTAIRGYAETLLSGALDDPVRARNFLGVIDRHSERLSRLIDDLLTLSDLELGKSQLKKEAVLLESLVAEAPPGLGEK